MTRKQARMRRRRIRIAGFCFAGCILIFGIVCGAFHHYVSQFPEDKIAENIYVGTVDLSGLSKKEALEKLAGQKEADQKQTVSLTVEGQKAEATLEECGFDYADVKANTLTCYSFSKSLSLPGERIGYVAVNPACEDAETMINMCGQISRGIGHNCPPSIIQLAVAQVLDKTADLSVYETNMNILYKELTDLGFTCVKPGGTFYIFPKALEEDAKVFSQKALKYDLVLVPGDSFGAPGYFRMAYCVDTEKVERSLEALRRFVKEEYGRE